MNEFTTNPTERVSALADGCLQEDEVAQALAAVLSDPRAMQTWHAYHVVGDVLRSPELAPLGGDFAFLEKLEYRLRQEQGRPASAAPEEVSLHAVALAADTAPLRAGLHSANKSVFRWKMLASAVSMVLVVVVGVGLWSPPTARMVAQVQAPPVVDVSPAMFAVNVREADAEVMIRNARLDELMAAHRQLGGHSALQVPAGFLRNATFEEPAR